jgi:hypothetical protein
MDAPMTAADDDRQGAIECFQALQRAFDATLASAQGQAPLSPALMAQAFDIFEGNVALWAEGDPALACQRGCAACCSLRVAASAPEVWVVARFLRAVSPALQPRGIDLPGLVRQAAAATRRLGDGQRVALRRPCPFLARGQCVIYTVRPLACRGHASHDVRACQAAAAGLRADVPHSQGHRLVRALVQNALQASLRAAGLAWSLYEFIEAVPYALDQPDAEDAWRAGADPLAAARIDDVPAHEMAPVFDRLRPPSPQEPMK